MITLFTLGSFIILYAKYLKVLYYKYFIFNVIFSFFILSIALLEVIILKDNTLFVMPDEQFYYHEAQNSFHEIFQEHSRYLLYILLSYLNFNVGGAFNLKIQSLGFVLLTLLLIYDYTKRKEVFLLFPLVFPYLYHLSTFNLRDPLIIFLVLLFILILSRTQKLFFIIVSTTCFFVFLYIRPEFSILFMVVCSWRALKFLNIGIGIKSLLFICCFIFFIFVLYIDTFANLFLPSFISDRVLFYLAERSMEVSNIPFLNSNMTSFIRQLLTPFPTSKINMLIYDGIQLDGNLLFKELYRISLMTFVYLMFFLIIINYRKAIEILSKSLFLQLFFIFSLIITILYSIYGDGGGSTRNKIYPFLFLFILNINIFLPTPISASFVCRKTNT